MEEKSKGASLKHIAEQFRRRLARVLLSVGIARLVLAAVLLFAIGAALDWAFHIPFGWRLVPLAIFISILSALAYVSIVRPLRERWTDKEILAWLDRRGSASTLFLDHFELSEAEGIEERNHPQGQRLLDEAIAAGATGHDIDAIIRASFRASAIRQWGLAAAAAIAVVLVAAIVIPVQTRVGAVRFFNPFSTIRWPHHTNIAIIVPPGGWNIPQGEPLTVKASVSGVEIPHDLELAYRVVPRGNWVREHLVVANDRTAAYTFPEVREPLEFQLSGGDDTTDRVNIRIIRSPSLEKIVVHVISPSYSGIPEQTRQGGDIEGLEGAHVRVEFTSSVPLKSASFTFDGEKEQTPAITDGLTFSTEFMLTKSTAYTVGLIGQSGVHEARPERYEIRVRPDEPPEAQITSPDSEIEGTANAAYKVAFNASDDFELGKVEFLYRMDNGPLVALSDRVTGPIAVHCKKTQAAFTWDLAQMNIPARDVVNLEYFVRATDTNPTGRGVTESSHHRIRVLKPSLYRESLLVTARTLVDEALLAEKNQRLAYQAGRKFLSGAGTGAEDDPVWTDMTTLQTGAFDAARAMSAQLSLLLERATDNRIQEEFMTARLWQIAEILRGVMDNQHANIVRQLEAARPRDAVQSAPAAMKARRTETLRAINETETGQKRAALELQRILFLVFDWNDLQSAAVSGLRLYEQQEDCSRQTGAIAPVFIGKDIKDLSDEDQEKLIDLGKAQRVIYDAETVLEGHLEEILTKAERQKRQSIRVPIYGAYSELRNRRVKDRLLIASDAIADNQPADILNEQKTALDALRVVKAELEAAGVPEKLGPLALSTEVMDIDAEDSRKQPNVEQTLAPAPLVMTDRQGTDPLTTALLGAGDALDDLVRRSEYLAGHDSSGDLPRFQRLRFGRLEELGTAADQLTKQTAEIANKANEAFVQSIVTGLDGNIAGAVRLIGQKDITPNARKISSDAAAGMNDLVQLLATERAVKEMKAEHDRQGGVDPFKRPYVLKGPDLAAAVDAIDGMLELRVELQEAARCLDRLQPPSHKPGELLATLEAGMRQQLRSEEPQLAAQWGAINAKIATISDANRLRITQARGDRVAQDPSIALSAQPGQETQGAAQLTRDVAALAQSIQGMRDLLDARGVLAPKLVLDAAPSPQDTSRMTEAQYAKFMSLPALKARIARMSQLPPAIRDTLLESLSHQFPPEDERFLATYVNSILSAAKEDKP